MRKIDNWCRKGTEALNASWLIVVSFNLLFSYTLSILQLRPFSYKYQHFHIIILNFFLPFFIYYYLFPLFYYITPP